MFHCIILGKIGSVTLGEGGWGEPMELRYTPQLLITLNVGRGRESSYVVETACTLVSGVDVSEGLMGCVCVCVLEEGDVDGFGQKENHSWSAQSLLPSL